VKIDTNLPLLKEEKRKTTSEKKLYVYGIILFLVIFIEKFFRKNKRQK